MAEQQEVPKNKIEEVHCTLSVNLFQRLRDKYGDNIDFHAQTPIVDDVLQSAASGKKTGSKKSGKKKSGTKKESSIAYNRFARAYNRFARAYNRFAR